MGLAARHMVGIENILWSTDFPHPVTSWPDSQDVIDDVFGAVPADERQKMLCDNAVRIWNL